MIIVAAVGLVYTTVAVYVLCMDYVLLSKIIIITLMVKILKRQAGTHNHSTDILPVHLSELMNEI